VEDTWTQQQQSALEKAIVTYRSITNSVEKWNAIANDVPDKDTDACIKRFKECREKAIAAKKEKKKEESESEEEESSENEEESSENEEISEENEIGNEPEEDESEEEEEKKEFEKTKEKSLESDYNVYLNLVIKVNDLKMKQVGVINLEEVIVLVKCQKCKDEVDKRLTLHKEFTDYLYNDVLCANCNTSGIILLKKSFLHGGSNIFGRMGSNSWDILDVFTVNVNAVCEMCNHGQVFEKYVVGTSINFNCHSCFKENGFSFSSYSLTFEEYAEIFKKKPQNTSKAPNNEESKKMKTKKVKTKF
jgi:chemotaxis protein histidine kinase CheA